MITNKSPPAPPKDGDLFIPPNERKTLPMLKRGECRWPYGDPGKKNFYYCGKSKPDDHPYCGFLCVAHSSPHGPASTDRTNRARLPSLFVPIGAKAHRNAEGRSSSQPTSPLNCHGRARVNQATSNCSRVPQVSIVHRAIAQSAKPTCARQYPSAAQTVQPLPPKGVTDGI